MNNSVVEIDTIRCWDMRFHMTPIKKSEKYDGIPQYKIRLDLNKRISHWQGDITSLKVDAIVHVTNKQLIYDEKEDQPIHDRASVKLEQYVRRFNGCNEGEAVITPGFDLPAKYVIHTVPPKSTLRVLLANCYRCIFKRMLEHDVKTVAIPYISSAIDGYSNEDGAHVALRLTREFLEMNHDKVDRIIFCTSSEKDQAIYDELLQFYFPPAIMILL